jgi:uncharacterized protein involved in outer membrane biogenesis
MRWRRLAFWLSIGTLTLIVLAITWLWTADLGVFKPQVERFVSEQTGRELSIDGNFYVDLARHATVIAEDLRFQNADWAEQDDMVTVGRLEVRVDLWSLIMGPFVIELVDIDDASVYLINPQDGDPNWILPIDDQPSVEETPVAFDFLVEQIDIDGSEVTLDSARRNRPLNLQIDSYRQQHRDDDLLQFDFDALLDGRVVRIDGEVGTWNALLAGQNIQFDVDSVLDTFEMTASGRIDDLIDPRYPEIDFAATGPDVDDLTRLLGLGDEGDGDINLSGSLQKDANEQLVLEANGNFGQTEIESRGTVSNLQDLRNIDVDMLASGPDFGRIARLFGIHQVREAPFTVRVDAETQGETFIVNEANISFGEAQIDVRARMPKFPSIDDAVIGLLIEGPDIARFRHVTGLPGAAEGAFSLGFTIDVNEDGVEVLRLDLETSLGEIRGNGRLGAPPDFLSSLFDLQIRSDSLERLASAYGIEDLPDYPIEFTGEAEYIEGGIRSIGAVTATVGQVTATLDGFVALQRRIIGSDLAFTLTGPDLADMIGAFIDATGVPEQAYDLRGRFEARDDGFRFREVTGSVGSSSVDIDGLLTTRSGFDGTRFDFQFAGPALQEIIEEIGDLEVRRGPYELSGSIRLQPDMLQLRDIDFDRTFGDVKADLDLGLPVSRKWINFDVNGRGRDVRSVLRGLDRFEAFEQAFSLGIRGSLRGDYWNFDQLDIGIGESILQAEGDLDLTDARRTTEFSFNLTVPNLASLGTIDGRAFNEQAFSLVAHVDGRDGALTVDQLNAVVGQSDLRGFIQLRKGDVPSLDIDVYSDSLTFAPLLEEIEFEYDPKPKFDDGRLIPDVVMPFDAMREIDVSVDIDIKELQRGPLYMTDIELDAILRDGILEIQNAQFKPRSGELLARARLEPAGESATASIELIARNFALGMSQTNLDLAMTGDIDMKLESTGADLRTLLGNANGMILLSARGGRVTNSPWLNRMYGDLLSEILNTINPFRSSDPYTDFECVVVPLLFDDGSLTSAPNVFVSTNRIRMAATPSINLKTEDLRVVVRTTPRRALSVSMGELVNPYVQVVGTLAAPRLAVDEKGVLITGGAAVATGGLTLIARGLWDRLTRSGDPCGQLTDQALKQLEGRFPGLTIEDTERLR